MIELRYLITKRNRFEPLLQYRVMTNLLELGIREPIYGEWQTVPTVIESK